MPNEHIKVPKFEQETKLEKGPKEAPTRFDYYKLMSGIVERAEELMTKEPDLPAERFANFLIYDKRNEAVPTPEQEEIVQKMAQRFADARSDALSYARDVADKVGLEPAKMPKKSLELLEKNCDAKLQFLQDLGFEEPIDPTKFKIHTIHPTAIGVECIDLGDYTTMSGWTPPEAMTTNGFFLHTDFTRGIASKEDKARIEKLNEKIYFLNGENLIELTKKQREQIEIHEIQHHLFSRYFDISKIAELRHAREEIEWRIHALPKLSALERLQKKDVPVEKIEKYRTEFLSFVNQEMKLRKREMKIPSAEYLERRARNELAAYLKMGDYRYVKKHLFGEENYALVENPQYDKMQTLRVRFDKLKEELWRLEAGGVAPKSLYRIFELMPKFNDIIEQLSKIETGVTEKGLKNLLNDEADPKLLLWLKARAEQGGLDIKLMISEIENWCAERLYQIFEKNVEQIGKSDLSLAEEYILRTQSLSDRIPPGFKEVRNHIAGICLENIYNEAKKMDPILASAIKEASYNPYTGNKIETINERIAFADDVVAELRIVWDDFNAAIFEIKTYDSEEARMFMGEIPDPKDGHRLTLHEKLEEAKEELKDLEKIEQELNKMVEGIYKIDKGQSLLAHLTDAGWRELSIREKYKKIRKIFEELKKK